MMKPSACLKTSPNFCSISMFSHAIMVDIPGDNFNLLKGKISNESPIGSAILGAKKNQIVEVQAPAGVMQYKVLSITK